MDADLANRDPAATKLPVATWGFGAALLIVEYVLALLLFDSDRLPIPKDSNAFGYLGESMPLVIVVMTATLLIGRKPFDEERQAIAAAFASPRSPWPFLSAHLVLYAVALTITVFVFNAQLEVRHPWLWVASWGAAAVASLVLWVAAMLPMAAIRPISKPLARATLSGIVVGLLALGAGFASSVLWHPMSRATLEIVAFLLGFAGYQVTVIPEALVVGTQSYEVFVDRPCSGYEGIGLIVVMLSVYLVVFRRSLRFPNALSLLPIGIVLIWLSNSFRIASLIMVGSSISPGIAEGGFHSAAGWLLFCAVTLGLIAASKRYAWFSLEPSGRARFRTPEGAFLLPLLFLVAANLLTALVTSDFDYLYPLRIVAATVPLWFFRSYYRELRWSWSWTPMLLGLAVFVLWVALEPTANSETVSIIPDALATMPAAWAALWLISRVVGSVVIVPIAEELAFRGYLLRRLVSADFTRVSPNHFTAMSFVISSLAFGLLHGRWLAGILAGMAYALAQYRRGQILDAIVAHAVTNLLLAVYVLAFGQWGFW